MSKKIDEIGNRYGRLEVISEAERHPTHGWARWECLCTCGNTTVVVGSFLRNGNTNSCGCYQREASSRSNKKHGLSYDRRMKAIYEAGRRARLRGAKGSYTQTDIETIYEKQKGLCLYCRCVLDDSFHRDHKVPLSRGGTNYPRNIALTCGSCNLKKQNKTASEFKKLLGGYCNGGEERQNNYRRTRARPLVG